MSMKVIDKLVNDTREQSWDAVYHGPVKYLGAHKISFNREISRLISSPIWHTIEEMKYTLETNS